MLSLSLTTSSKTGIHSVNRIKKKKVKQLEEENQILRSKNSHLKEEQGKPNIKANKKKG